MNGTTEFEYKTWQHVGWENKNKCVWEHICAGKYTHTHIHEMHFYVLLKRVNFMLSMFGNLVKGKEIISLVF